MLLSSSTSTAPCWRSRTRPSAVRVDRQLLALVQRIHEAAGGAVALISGRRIADIDGLFPGLRLPLAGQHGIERRDAAGGLHIHPAPLAELARLRQHFDDIVAAHPGLLLEDKGATLAVHYRRAPQAEAEVLRALTGILKRLGEGFRIQPGKMVFEIKPAGKDKGTAIAEFMEEAPFRGRIPVFLGDDVTDEYGFHVVNAAGRQLHQGGDGPHRRRLAPARCRRRARLARALPDAPGAAFPVPGG